VVVFPAPESQIAFNRGRAEAQTSRFEDDAAVRKQTIRMYGKLSDLQDAVSARNKVDFACRRGCSYCCHLRVEIRPHDAFVLAHHILTKFTTEQRTAAIVRIGQTLERTESLTPEQHIRAGIPCALLQEGVCSAYEARPATCRKYHSVSVDTCRDAFNDTSAPLTGDIEDEQVRLAGNAVALGYAKGLDDAGYDAELYELHYALHIALTNPKAGKRYRKGKRAFVTT
jgi:Fe-S-cluster containining protein